MPQQRREEKRQAGEARNADWATLSPAQQLVELDRRLGKGLGATKQRKSLAKKLEGGSK